MTSTERFLTALKGEIPDRVPLCEFSIAGNVIQDLLPGGTYEEFIETFDFDAVVVSRGKDDIQKVNANTFIDPWGTTFAYTGEEALIETDFPIKNEDDFRSYSAPDPLSDPRLPKLDKTVERFKGKKAVVFTISDSFSQPRKLLGMENLLLSYIEEPSFLTDLIDMTVDFQIALMEEAIKRGAEVIFSADDYAGNLGPIMSPVHYDTYIFPGLKRIVETAHKLGALYIKHTDGMLWPIMDSLLASGIDGLNPIDSGAGMDIREVKEKIGDSVCIIGNVDCQYTLEDGTQQEVISEVKGLLESIAPGGGYMMSSSNSIHSGVNPENYLTMIETTKKFGTYPIHTGKR